MVGCGCRWLVDGRFDGVYRGLLMGGQNQWYCTYITVLGHSQKKVVSLWRSQSTMQALLGHIQREVVSLEGDLLIQVSLTCNSE